MSTLATILLTAAGVLLILVALRDVFDVLFHETGRAVLSHGVMRTVWRGFRVVSKARPTLFSLAGPLALIAVVISWALMLIVGWTFVYWPHMPDSFSLGSGVDPSHPFVDSFYFSMATLSTVGFGDVSPGTEGLRLISPIEALLGFGLLTASISWLLAIYPVLSRRRSLAYEINLLMDSKELIQLEESGDLFSELTSRLVAVERDLATLPVAYYFTPTDERFALPAHMHDLLELAERGIDESLPPYVRLRASMLHEAIDDFARTVQGIHRLPGESTGERLDAYTRDHLAR
jgi:hypothetical protein